jgi:4'-phosphopantetheinyl transferase
MYTIVCPRNVDPDLAMGRPPAGLLTREEAALFAGLKTEKRRRDWLTGRYAAKHLVCHALQAETGNRFSFADFAVLPKESGAPELVWRFENRSRPVTLSISHSGELAFCALSLEPAAWLGCDVEQVAPRSPAFVNDYFTPAEQALLHRTPPGRQPVLANAIWSAKEAVLKVLAVGLTVDTRAVICLPEDKPGPDYQPFSVALDGNRIAWPEPELAGRWRVDGAYVFTLAAPVALFSQVGIETLTLTKDLQTGSLGGQHDDHDTPNRTNAAPGF